jgi:hypothetical protein
MSCASAIAPVVSGLVLAESEPTGKAISHDGTLASLENRWFE